ncbi:MAG: hypothetical protein KKG75_05270 [Nanoarchaeota archaeon]|nr:hypothetical protein [Nanoarchaeota archaeon]
MANDNGLVDEFEKLQIKKKEIEIQEEKLKQEILKLAEEKNINILFGTHMKCSLKEYTKVVYPEDKTLLVELIRSKGLYEELSSINYFKLNPRITKGNIDKEIIDLTKQEKAFRFSFKNIK